MTHTLAPPLACTPSPRLSCRPWLGSPGLHPTASPSSPALASPTVFHASLGLFPAWQPGLLSSDSHLPTRATVYGGDRSCRGAAQKPKCTRTSQGAASAQATPARASRGPRVCPPEHPPGGRVRVCASVSQPDFREPSPLGDRLARTGNQIDALGSVHRRINECDGTSSCVCSRSATI